MWLFSVFCDYIAKVCNKHTKQPIIRKMVEYDANIYMFLKKIWKEWNQSNVVSHFLITWKNYIAVEPLYINPTMIVIKIKHNWSEIFNLF